MNTTKASDSQWRQALSIAPLAVINRLSEIFNDQEKKKCPSGGQKRKLKAITEPSRQCFRMLNAQSDDGTTIQFASGDFVKIIHYIGEHAEWHKEALLQIPGNKLNLILYMDECTGGNVLATASNKRMYFFYVCIRELGYLHSSTAFLPWACIPAKDLADDNAPDMSAVTRAILHDWLGQKLNTCVLHGRRFSIALQSFLGDYDAIRLVFSTKGAAGLKPCALCSNVLSKARPEAEADDFFVTISSSEPARFIGYNMDEFFTIYDESLQNAEHLTKTRLKETEKFFGFLINKNCLFADQRLRQLLNLSHVVIDSTHCYYANGIAAQEMMLMMQFMQSKHNITTDLLRQSIREVDWKSRDEHFASPSGRSFLFQPSFWTGDLFKGSASQVWYLLPWLHFHLHELLTDHTCPEWRCFAALVNAHYALRAIRSGGTNYSWLDQSQIEHQKLFSDRYGEAMRPKHHLRLHLPHLPQIYKEKGYSDSFPCEKKHQSYR